MIHELEVMLVGFPFPKNIFFGVIRFETTQSLVSQIPNSSEVQVQPLTPQVATPVLPAAQRSSVNSKIFHPSAILGKTILLEFSTTSGARLFFFEVAVYDSQQKITYTDLYTTPETNLSLKLNQELDISHTHSVIYSFVYHATSFILSTIFIYLCGSTIYLFISRSMH